MENNFVSEMKELLDNILSKKISFNEFFQIFKEKVEKNFKPLDLLKAEKTVKNLSSEWGFMGSPEYYEAIKIIESYKDKTKHVSEDEGLFFNDRKALFLKLKKEFEPDFKFIDNVKEPIFLCEIGNGKNKIGFFDIENAKLIYQKLYGGFTLLYVHQILGSYNVYMNPQRNRVLVEPVNKENNDINESNIHSYIIWHYGFWYIK